MKIHKNDTVLVVAGKDRGKQGKVIAVNLKTSYLTVEGINLLKKHVKSRPDIRQAGIIERPNPMAIGKVRLICTKCSKPTRVGYTLTSIQEGESTKNHKVRVCKQCNQQID